MSGAADEPPTGFRLTWDINITTVLVLIGAIASGMYFVASTRTSGEVTAQEIHNFEQSVERALEGIRAEIRTLPDQQARLNEAERRLTEDRADFDHWKTIFETKVGQDHDDLTQMRSELTSLERGSAQDLGGHRR